MTTLDLNLMNSAARDAGRNQPARQLVDVDRLRSRQQQLIDIVLNGRDALAVVPTGSGPSLCYQIPARLRDAATAGVARAALFDQLAQAYARKQERERESRAQMAALALSGTCGNRPQRAGVEIGGDDVATQDQPDPAPQFETGVQVRVPRFDVGTVVGQAGDQVTIAFPEQGTRTFLADYVQLA